MPLHLEVITPERKVYEDDVDMVIAPGSEGYLGILPHHAPLLTALGPGEFRVKKGGVEEVLAVFGGFMEVRPDRVVVLTEAAEPAEEIDTARAQAARARAQETLSQAATLSAADEARARAELQRALVRLRVSERRRPRRT
ncbi:MAG: F0F1 ATP synthase subunit epsilon [Chloroflexi bacterium]|nr:MAG: F0F1 ATP synthase subunit epsilon [Chloroflexota bacterium]TMC30642.1 MAG: F0F1 ATP synthase subunit epsilon [Chloroflexota bacterium]TMC33322.1 MAG: F0F1 ATP synthase subunit epsilon [Chloroflexota bacterium]TMC55807.1 MAG: F0F1 ATP synthase subunit epsilon [Chloroflexota bacterium]TME36462.1 MAG: F0F1 ATP synthase subunit epsilon [Chloroflexota bacterium]